MRHDLCLRFTNESDAISQLASLRSGGAWVQASHIHAIDVIGPMVITPPVLNADRTVATPAEIDTRFHINLQTNDDTLAAALAAYVVTPSPRLRVWA